MKKIQLYIFKEFVFPLLIGCAFFTFVFIIPPLKNLVGLTLEKGIPFNITAQLFLYSLPFTGAITIPMGVLFGTLFAMGRLSGDNEIIAIRSLGYSYLTIAFPTVLFGALMTIFTFLFINFVMPETNTRYKTLYANVVYSNPSILIEDRAFKRIPNTEKKIAAIQVSEDNDFMEEVFLYELEKEKNEITLTYAKNGRWLSNAINAKLTSLELLDGESLKINRTNPDEIQKVKFDSIVVNIVNEVREIQEAVRKPREQSVFDLRKEIQKLIQKNEEISPIMYIEYHKKYSLPLSCVIFTIIALPLGISFRRGGKGTSFGIAILLIFVYYFVMTTTETLGKRGHIDPALSTYVPTAFFGILSLILSFFKLRQ